MTWWQPERGERQKWCSKPPWGQICGHSLKMWFDLIVFGWARFQLNLSLPSSISHSFKISSTSLSLTRSIKLSNGQISPQPKKPLITHRSVLKDELRFQPSMICSSMNISWDGKLFLYSIRTKWFLSESSQSSKTIADAKLGWISHFLFSRVNVEHKWMSCLKIRRVSNTGKDLWQFGFNLELWNCYVTVMKSESL